MTEEAIEQARVLVVGFGQPAGGDESLGARAVLTLAERFSLPGYVSLRTAVDVDQALLEQMEGTSFLLAADYFIAAEEVGRIFLVPLDEFERPAEPPESCHEAALLENLGVLEVLGGRPPAVLLAVGVGESSPGAALSLAAEGALPALVERLAEELAKVGVPLLPRG